jgi:ATP-dependent DNA ligase
LDGFRCLANKNELYSKGMKKFVFLHHIKKEIAKIKELNNNIYLDGELYEHGLKLHDISSLVMKKYASHENEKSMEQISYYIFDMFDLSCIQDETFSMRYKKLINIFNKYKFKYLKLVKCTLVYSYEEIKNINTQYIYDGYEGVIVRNLNGLYKLNSKSYDVLRTKEFKRKLFKIIFAKEGSGTQKGAIIWKLKCLNSTKTFWAIPIGTIKERIAKYKDYVANPSLYIGLNAIVKYLELDNKDGCVSRNPIVENIYHS